MVLFRTTCAHGIRPAEFSPRMKHRILVRYNFLSHKRQVSTSESVHIPLRGYPWWAADTLMSMITLFTSQGLRFPQSRVYRFTSCAGNRHTLWLRFHANRSTSRNNGRVLFHIDIHRVPTDVRYTHNSVPFQSVKKPRRRLQPLAENKLL